MGGVTLKGRSPGVENAPAASTGGLSVADRAALEAYLGECDDLQPGISAPILDYILNGRNETVLLAVRALPGQTPCLTGHLSRNTLVLGPNGPHWDATDSAKYMARAAARQRFLHECEGWDAAAFRRLGLVLVELNARAGSTRYHGAGTAHTPAWFRALLEAVRSVHTSSRGCLGVLDAARCLEMLVLDGFGAEALIDVCFGSTDYFFRWAGKNLQKMRGLRAAFAATPRAVVLGLGRLPAAAQAEAVTWIGRAVGLKNPILYEEMLRLLILGGKQVGGAALNALRVGDLAQLRARGDALLISTDPRERLAGVQILGRIIGPDALASLRARNEVEKIRAVAQALRETILALEAAGGGSEAPASDGETGFTSADGAWIEIPPFSLPPDTPFPEGVATVLREAAMRADRLARDRHAAMLADHQARQARGERSHHNPAPYASLFDPRGVDVIPDVANGATVTGEAPWATHTILTAPSHPYAEAGRECNLAVTAMVGTPGISPYHLARLISFAFMAGEGIDPPQGWAAILYGWGWGLGTPLGQHVRRLLDTGLDARAVLAMGSPWAPKPAAVVEKMAAHGLRRLSEEERSEAVIRGLWPLIAQNLTVLDDRFGLAASATGHEPDPNVMLRALELLSLLPALPRRFLPGVLDAALGGHPEVAPAARAMLRGVASATPLLVGMLKSSDAVRRQRAALMLAETGDRAHVSVLRRALARERTETVRAGLLRGLVRLGDDISDQFSEATLLKQAKTGLAKAGAKLRAWFPMDAVPPVVWQDGRAVPAELVQWWLVLADKIRLAGGDPLMRMTLDRLDRPSAARLGTFVLSAFVAHDTKRATAAEASDYAEQNADASLARRQRWHPDFTREQAFEELRRGKLGQYFGSAHNHRGILALARHAPGGEAVQMVRAYFRDHYTRIAQCKALLECLAGNPHHAALQLVLATANRYRTAGVQKRAAELVDEIARENGWSRDELADRTVPTGGLDEDGVLELPIGERVFRAVLDAAPGKFGITLINPDGKPIKALPGLPAAAPQSDVEDLAAAKKALGNLRKELKQTAELQTARMYEAMCAARTWGSADFEAFLLRHPLMAPLCQRLVFAGLDAGGAVVATFRPMSDGSLTGPADEAVELDRFVAIRVAHRALLPDEISAAWRRHLADYEVSNLFDQFDRPPLDFSTLAEAAVAFEDRKGWMIETFKLRGAASRLGYQRAKAEDHGIFSSYDKPFASLGLVARLGFTGAQLPETNTMAALTTLGVHKQSGSGVSYKPVALRSLPPILLNEVWNDLHKVAAAGTGFDSDWEEKSQWW